MPGSGSHFIGAHKEFTGFFVISAVVVCWKGSSGLVTGLSLFFFFFKMGLTAHVLGRNTGKANISNAALIYKRFCRGEPWLFVIIPLLCILCFGVL